MKGDQTNFEIEPSFGVEASQLVGFYFGQYPGLNGNKDPEPPKKLYLLVGGLDLVHHSYILG